MRHEGPIARRMGRSARRDYQRRRRRPRNPVAQQEIFPLETVAGSFRFLEQARKDRLRDPSGLNQLAVRTWPPALRPGKMPSREESQEVNFKEKWICRDAPALLLITPKPLPRAMFEGHPKFTSLQILKNSSR